MIFDVNVRGRARREVVTCEFPFRIVTTDQCLACANPTGCHASLGALRPALAFIRDAG
jgi:hypothetical protein